jgi:hypothetical protein
VTGKVHGLAAVAVTVPGGRSERWKRPAQTEGGKEKEMKIKQRDE